MKIFTDQELKLFTTIATCHQYQLKASLEKYLESHYDNIIKRKEYTIAVGDIPVVMVAHLDTVFLRPPENIYYDREKGICWSPDGLGADDRAGVFAILQIIRQGYKPHIIFTTDEEVGCLGASALTKVFRSAPKGMDIKFVIQLDRRGQKDSVYYDCGNKKFEKFINKFGFKTSYGSYSDISILCPAWGVAGVNLSIGYELEHSMTEYLSIPDMYDTIDKVCKILESTDPHMRKFTYQGVKRQYKWKGPGLKGMELCAGCLSAFDKVNLIPVEGDNFCIDCFVSFCSTCKNCGKSYVAGAVDKDRLCKECGGTENAGDNGAV